MNRKPQNFSQEDEESGRSCFTYLSNSVIEVDSDLRRECCDRVESTLFAHLKRSLLVGGPLLMLFDNIPKSMGIKISALLFSLVKEKIK